MTMPKSTWFAVIVLIGVSLGACAQDDPSHDVLPHDVAMFTDQRDMCDHMRGEIPDPPAPERMREIEGAIEK
jgi:hypothetical protein